MRYEIVVRRAFLLSSLILCFGSVEICIYVWLEATGANRQRTCPGKYHLPGTRDSGLGNSPAVVVNFNVFAFVLLPGPS